MSIVSLIAEIVSDQLNILLSDIETVCKWSINRLCTYSNSKQFFGCCTHHSFEWRRGLLVGECDFVLLLCLLLCFYDEEWRIWSDFQWIGSWIVRGRGRDGIGGTRLIRFLESADVNSEPSEFTEKSRIKFRRSKFKLESISGGSDS